MGQSIAVMNTKGGVGKSTLVMALAETLSVEHAKNVLVIDSDSQTSMSIMLMPMERWEQLERQKLTLVDFLTRAVLDAAPSDWKPYVATGVSDVEEAVSVYLVPSHMQLSLFERMISGEHKHDQLRETVRTFLADARRYFDIILIDCPPGLSVLTEIWLREADFFLPPTKPDYLSVRGLDVLKRFRDESLNLGFAELLGVAINQKDGRITAEQDWQQRIQADSMNRAFESVVPRRAYIQKAADFTADKRTYMAKYPGDAGTSIRALTAEVVDRLARAERGESVMASGAMAPQPAPPVTAVPVAAEPHESAAAPPPVPHPPESQRRPATASETSLRPVEAAPLEDATVVPAHPTPAPGTPSASPLGGNPASLTLGDLADESAQHLSPVPQSGREIIPPPSVPIQDATPTVARIARIVSNNDTNSDG